MGNPIMKMLNNRINPVNNGNSIANLIKTLSSQNPDQIFAYMLKTNPKFAEFVDANKGKSIEQMASDYNIDLNAIKQFMK